MTKVKLQLGHLPLIMPRLRMRKIGISPYPSLASQTLRSTASYLARLVRLPRPSLLFTRHVAVLSCMMFSKPVPTLPEPTLPISNLTVAQRQLSDTGGVKSKRESAEYRAYQRCFSVLADGITDPGRLAVQLFSKDLIGPELRKEAQKQAIEERVKIERLLAAVEGQIETCPAARFGEFLDVLQNEPSLQHLATRLESTYHELSEQCRAHNLPSPPLPVTSQQPQHPPLRSDVTFLPPTMHFQQGYPLTHSSSQFSASAVGTYASYLKSVYTREKLPIYDKWPKVKSKKYINLALIEKRTLQSQRQIASQELQFMGTLMTSRSQSELQTLAKLPSCQMGHNQSASLWRVHQVWGSPPLLGNSATSGGRGSCSSSTS